MIEILQKIVPIYALVMTLITFISFGIDKQKAKKHKWRIPEKTLIVMMLAGGFLGGWIGMWIFHHKTKHPKFYVGFFASVILWGLIVFYILK